MENPEVTTPVEPEPAPYRSTYIEFPELRIRGRVQEMNKPGPNVFEAIQSWVADFTIKQLLNDEEEVNELPKAG